MASLRLCVTMTDRILPDDTVTEIEKLSRDSHGEAPVWISALCASHRLLQKRVTELEGERDDFKEIVYQRICNQCAQFIS